MYRAGTSAELWTSKPSMTCGRRQRSVVEKYRVCWLHSRLLSLHRIPLFIGCSRSDYFAFRSSYFHPFDADARPFELPIWFDCTGSSVISTGCKQRRQAIRATEIGRPSADGNHSLNSTSGSGSNVFGNLYEVLVPLQSCKRVF